MTDIYLINPPQPKPDKSILTYAPISPSLGLSYVAAALDEEDLSIKAFDFDLKDTNIGMFKESLTQDAPAIVGLTCLTNTYLTAITLAQIIKTSLPETKIILGGQHVTFCYEDALSYDFVDYVIIGEGEKSFVELCRAILNKHDVRKIKGIAFKDGNKQVYSLPEEIEDIDSIRFPKREIFNMKKYIDPVSIISSRGCSAKCIFCSASAFRGAKVRFRSAENVLEEIKVIYDQGIRTVNFMDDNFMLKKQRVVDICKTLKKKYSAVFWTCSARADNFDKDLMKLVSASGCKGLHFGAETVSEGSQKSIGKFLSIEKLENALTLAKKYGVSTYASFIIGLPDEDEKQVRKNIDYAISLNRKYNTTAVFGILTPFPGTKIYTNPEEYGIKNLSQSFSDYDIFTPVIETRYLDQKQLRALLFDAQKEYIMNMSMPTLTRMQIYSQIVQKFERQE